MTQHDWDSHALPGRTYHKCRRKGCIARGMTYKGTFRRTHGPKECTPLPVDPSPAERRLEARGRE